MTWWQMMLPWEFSPLLMVATALTALWYYRHRAAATGWQQGAFWTGLALLYGVSHTGFEYYAEHEFFMHRLQHLVLHHAGPFLIVLGLPRPLMRCTSLFRDRLHRGRVGPLIVRFVRIICHPILTAFLFNALVLFWLIPAVHLPAMLDWRLYRVMNLGILINGLLFWAAGLRGVAPWKEDLRVSRQVLLMIAVVPAQIVMGALIFFAPRDLYPVYALCGRAFDGLTSLQDQQIGGLVLWIPGAMMSVAGIVIVLMQRFRQPGL